MSWTYEWEFPLPRTHTGIVQGNGTLGVMIWGEGPALRITLGRADFWDHRGAVGWTGTMSYANIRSYLARGDEAGLQKLFNAAPARPGLPGKPSILPVGRLEIDFGTGARLLRGTLNLKDGMVRLFLQKGGTEHELCAVLDMSAPRWSLRFPRRAAPVRVRGIPAWEHVGKFLESVAFRPPTTFRGRVLSGWIQATPADQALCAGWRQTDGELHAAAALGPDGGAARAAVERLAAEAAAGGQAAVAARTRRWWAAYWSEVPALEFPNERLAFHHRFGMYKLAGSSQPAGVPCTLQGPWIEEYQMPPWSSDYHFNINVQLCYWPAYHGNKLEHLPPLFDMVWSWLPALRENARLFLGVDDGLMLPHSVDDRCGCIGGYWAGSVDHGCTGWVALMMYRYYRYTMDRAFLRDRAYPFLKGAMRVFEGMLEREGARFTLPVSVSPEYFDQKGHGWGPNASFQLACIHAMCEALLASAAELGEAPRPIWAEILAGLPKASLIRGAPTAWRGRGADEEMIALWDGVPLEESHRHHSHLAGITPFDVFDLDTEPWKQIVERSVAHWIYRGMGLWSGWCVPWASMIQTRMGNADAADLLLAIWERVYTNQGHASLHDVDMPGFALMGMGPVGGGPRRQEIMQLDASLGATAAIQEMLLHTRRGVNHLFAGAPVRWKHAAFRGMRTDGAFLVSGERENGRVGRVTVESPAGGLFRLANPWPERAVVLRGRRRERIAGRVLALPTAPGETIRLEPK